MTPAQPVTEEPGSAEARGAFGIFAEPGTAPPHDAGAKNPRDATSAVPATNTGKRGGPPPGAGKASASMRGYANSRRLRPPPATNAGCLPGSVKPPSIQGGFRRATCLCRGHRCRYAPRPLCPVASTPAHWSFRSCIAHSINAQLWRPAGSCRAWCFCAPPSRPVPLCAVVPVPIPPSLPWPSG